ncbi:MAG: H(+)/Cl(-) exchange transporter ClcA [Candidatus Thorarchaeota archaeon AB_25]|nr:MAG: H(+)/Cl(-) exchange transporter ClcA [Candidatus Thorarchaeota archaeon AB_25]
MIQENAMKRQVLLYALGAFIGVVSGITAVLFRLLILSISQVFTIIPQVLGVAGWIIVPVLGGLIVAFIVVRYAPEAKGHGVPEVMESYVLHGGKIRFRVPLLKSMASAICIGSGGSCGREGPIAQIGAGAGSAVATALGLDKRERKTLLVCGLSSGIAATFNAPLGGALFGIEVIAGGIIGFSILPVILASVVATAIADLVLGTAVSFQAPLFVMGHPLELVFYLILGIILGVMSVIWTRGFYTIEDLLEKIRVSKYILPAFGGLLTGLLAIGTIYLENVFAYSGEFSTNQPYYPAIMGVGYPFIDATLIGNVALGSLLLFGLLKIFATSFTLGSGGSGGVFAPTLFIGAGLGGAFGLVSSALVPWAVPQPMAFALVGMAALFAGSGRAPITCIVMLMEMTADYSLILPLMIAVSTSFLVSSLIEPESIYTLKLSRRGVKIRTGTHISALKTIEVNEAMTSDPTRLHPTMTTTKVFEIIDKTHHTKFPVVDDFGNVIGILIAEDLFHEPKEDGSEYQVRELMNPDFLHLHPGCTVDSALQIMMKRDEGHAVIADPMDPQRMIGFITKADVLKAYEIAIIRLQKSGIDVDDINPAEIIDIGD